MKAQWQHYCERVAALSQRERVLILLTGLILVFALFYYGWLEGAGARLDQDRQGLVTAQRDLELMGLENQGKQAKLNRDPNLGVRNQLTSVKQQLARIDDELKAQTVDLIPADEMAAVLESLLANTSRLHMLALTTIAPTPLVPGDQADNLFKHGIRLKLEGGYFDVYQYLKALEALPRHFYWRLFDYRVQAHPTAVVEMEIYTLSTSKEFIRG